MDKYNPFDSWETPFSGVINSGEAYNIQIYYMPDKNQMVLAASAAIGQWSGGGGADYVLTVYPPILGIENLGRGMVFAVYYSPNNPDAPQRYHFMRISFDKQPGGTVLFEEISLDKPD